MKNFLGLTLFILVALGCNSSKTDIEQATNPSEGFYNGIITLNDSVDLPVIFEWKNTPQPQMVFSNSTEKLVVKDIHIQGDSVHLNFPVFNTSLHLKFTQNNFSGTFVKNDAENYRLEFDAEKTDNALLFEDAKPAAFSLNKRWKVTFRPNQENPKLAVGEFEQDGNKIKGTFLTETGDYRFLSGVLDSNILKLAGFDGYTLYKFVATVKSPGEMEGRFFSGKSRADKWVALRDDEFSLRKADSLTYLKKGYSTVEFSIPLSETETLDFKPENYANQVIILQILGSWCPNCMDESRFLQETYNKYHKHGLEIIGLSFEVRDDQAHGFKAIAKMKADLGLTYPIGFAGSTSQENREAVLPQLNKIMSFPTSIILDKKGNVRKIHTGFSGPSTSVYPQFVEETNTLIEKLLKEE